MVARTIRGLEACLARELSELGATDIQEQNRAVTFYGDRATLYRANLCSRTALRILKPIHRFKIANQQDLYRGIRDYDWSRLVRPRDSLAIDTAVHSPIFSNSLFVAMKTKDAIVDQFRDRTGKRPSVDLENPTIRIHLRLENTSCTVSLDSSGESLHRRGYRAEAMQAPINEVLAAGLIALAGWDPATPFVDPMCGAGTIPIEAALIVWNRAPGLGRKRFGFMNWPDYDAQLWEEIRQAALAKVAPAAPPVFAADVSERAIRLARSNLELSGLPAAAIQFEIRPLDQYRPPPGPGTVIMNPPYGERLRKGGSSAQDEQTRQSQMEQFYKSIGDRLKQVYTGYTACILSSNMEALKRVGLHASRKITLFNGPLECSYRRYELYSGSRKKNPQD